MHLYSKGMNHGGEKGAYYPIAVDAEGGLQIQMQRVLVASPTLANVYVKVGSVALMQAGHKAAWQGVRSFIESLGGVVERAVVSRLDVCGDVVGVETDALVSAHLEGRRLTRSRVSREFNQDEVTWCSRDRIFRRHLSIEGLIVGGKGAPLQMRIYNKLKEAQNDPVKWRTMLDCRWGGEAPSASTRVEFQMSREWLRDEFEIGDVDDCFSRLPALTRYLTSDWYRQTQRMPDRKNGNQKRSTTSAAWQAVEAAFGWAETDGPGQPYERGPLDASRHYASMRGSLSSLAAMQGLTFQSHDDLMQWATAQVAALVDREFAGKVVDKKRKLELRQAAPPSQLPAADDFRGCMNRFDELNDNATADRKAAHSKLKAWIEQNGREPFNAMSVIEGEGQGDE